jgi:myo-inositol-1(or 4)-monophosphatase
MAASRLSLRPFLETAHALADASGAAIMPHFRRSLTVENKARSGKPFDPVTTADKAAERAIRKALAARHPEHGIFGEEYGRQQGDSTYTWVIDPIDGTKAFITGTPLWGTLIGLQLEHRAILGLMDQPFTGERIWSDGKSATWRSPGGKTKRIKTRACPRLEDAIVATTNPDLLAPGVERGTFEAIKMRARMARYGGDCYSYCLLAAGHIDIIMECGLQPYDVVALIPIIEAAGGRITSWDGGRAEPGGRILAAGDPALHEEVLKQIAKR